MSRIFKIAFLAHLDFNLYRLRLPIMKEFVKKNNVVYAITPEGKYSSKFLESGIKHISYNIRRESLNPFLDLKTILEIFQILKTFKPSILYTFTIKPNIYGTIAGKFARVPIIINTVTGLGSFYVENNLKSKFVRGLINLFYGLVFLFSDVATHVIITCGPF